MTERRRHPPYLRGPGAAVVTVIPWADGEHAHERLLPPQTRRPGSGFLLSLPETGPRLLSPGRFPLGCSWGVSSIPTSLLPPPPPSPLGQPPLLRSPSWSMGPPVLQEPSPKDSDQPGECSLVSVADYMLLLTDYTSNAQDVHHRHNHTAHWGQTELSREGRKFSCPPHSKTGQLASCCLPCFNTYINIYNTYTCFYTYI